MTNPVATNPMQRQHQHLARPVRQQPLQHRQAAVAVRALLRHPPVHGQRAKQCHHHQDKGRDRGQSPRRERSDPRLVAQRGEVVHAGQAHDLPPRLHVPARGCLTLVLVEPARVGFLLRLQQPGAQSALLPCLVCHVQQRRGGQPPAGQRPTRETPDSASLGLPKGDPGCGHVQARAREVAVSSIWWWGPALRLTTVRRAAAGFVDRLGPSWLRAPASRPGSSRSSPAG